MSSVEEYVIVESHANRYPSRRTFLAIGATTALAVAVPAGSPAHAADHGVSADNDVSGRLRDLERTHAARLGVFAHNTVTGKTVAYRADERFPMCSVLKTLTVATILLNLDQHGEALTQHVRYTPREVADSGYAPITGAPDNLANGMTIAQLCAAAVNHSDNTAVNLLLRELGEHQDTTTPRAIGDTYSTLVGGNTLSRSDQQLLTTWLLGNTTNGGPFRAGQPTRQTPADTTGSGGYGTRNDVGITWTPAGTPIMTAVLTTHHNPDATPDDALVAKTTTLLATALG